MSWDPFLKAGRPKRDEPAAPAADELWEGPKVEERPDGRISVTFKATGNYDCPWVVVDGTAEFVASLLAVDGFKGKISQIMNQAITIDAFYKRQYIKERQRAEGKA